MNPEASADVDGSAPAAAPPAGGVTVRYWAGARAAAGVDEDREVPGATVAEVTAEVGRRRPALLPVLAVASLLVDGVRSTRDDGVSPGVVVEVLPPFAGG